MAKVFVKIRAWVATISVSCTLALSCFILNTHDRSHGILDWSASPHPRLGRGTSLSNRVSGEWKHSIYGSEIRTNQEYFSSFIILTCHFPFSFAIKCTFLHASILSWPLSTSVCSILMRGVYGISSFLRMMDLLQQFPFFAFERRCRRWLSSHPSTSRLAPRDSIADQKSPCACDA